MFEEVLNTPAFLLRFFCVSSAFVLRFVSSKQTSNAIFQIRIWFGDNLSSFEYSKKNALTTSFQKPRRGRDSSPLSLLIQHNTHAPWRTTYTIQTNGYHHHFFHSDTNPVFGQVLIHSFDKTHALVVTVELIWLLLLNIPSFNFVPTRTNLC